MMSIQLHGPKVFNTFELIENHFRHQTVNCSVPFGRRQISCDFNWSGGGRRRHRIRKVDRYLTPIFLEGLLSCVGAYPFREEKAILIFEHFVNEPLMRRDVDSLSRPSM